MMYIYIFKKNHISNHLSHLQGAKINIIIHLD